MEREREWPFLGSVARARPRQLNAHAGLVLDVLQIGAAWAEQLAAHRIARGGVDPNLEHRRAWTTCACVHRRRRHAATTTTAAAHAAVSGGWGGAEHGGWGWQLRQVGRRRRRDERKVVCGCHDRPHDLSNHSLCLLNRLGIVLLRLQSERYKRDRRRCVRDVVRVRRRLGRRGSHLR